MLRTELQQPGVYWQWLFDINNVFKEYLKATGFYTFYILKIN